MSLLAAAAAGMVASVLLDIRRQRAIPRGRHAQPGTAERVRYSTAKHRH